MIEDKLKLKRSEKIFNNKFEAYRKDAIKAAKDLLYLDDTIDRLKNAKTTNQIANIMRDARLAHFGRNNNKPSNEN